MEEKGLPEAQRSRQTDMGPGDMMCTVFLLCCCVEFHGGDERSRRPLMQPPDDVNKSEALVTRDGDVLESTTQAWLDSVPDSANASEAPCYTGMLLSLVEALQWPNLVIVFDESHEEMAWRVTDKLSETGSLLSLVSADQAWTNQGLRSLVHVGPHGARQKLYILVLCPAACAMDLLNGAREFEKEWGSETALRMTSQWLIMRTETGSNNEDFRSVTMDNVAVLAPKPEYVELEEEVNCTDIFLLQTLLWKEEGRQLSLVGWMCRCGEVVAPDKIFPNTRFGLNGRLLTVSTIQSLVFLKKIGNNSYEGLGMELVSALALALNFTFELVEVPDGQYGTYVGNGQMNGMVGVVQRKEADLAVAKLTASLERSQYVDFTTPYSRDYYTFCYRMPEPETTRWMLYFRPFKWHVIACLGGTAVATGFLLHVLCVLVPGCRDQKLMQGFHGIRRCMTLVLGAVVQKEHSWEPEGMSARMLAFSWWMLCVAIGAAYSGALVAVLAISTSATPIKTLKELVAQSKYSWGTKSGTYLYSTMRQSADPSLQATWAGMLKHAERDPGVIDSNSTVLFLKLKRDDYAMVAESAYLHEMAAKYDVQLQCGESFLPDPLALATQKNSSLTDLLSQVILNIAASGLYSQWQSTWLHFQENSSPTPQASLRAVGLPDTLVPFLALAGGVLLASVILLGERILHKKLQNPDPGNAEREGCLKDICVCK